MIHAGTARDGDRLVTAGGGCRPCARSAPTSPTPGPRHAAADLITFPGLPGGAATSPSRSGRGGSLARVDASGTSYGGVPSTVRRRTWRRPWENQHRDGPQHPAACYASADLRGITGRLSTRRCSSGSCGSRCWRPSDLGIAVPDGVVEAYRDVVDLDELGVDLESITGPGG